MSAETMSVVRTPASVFRAWRRRSRDQDKDLTPLPWLRAAFAVLIVVVGGGAVALWLTSRWAEQHIAGVAATDAPLVSVRLDAIKTGLTVAAGLGAGVTLLLALRRQAISERAQRTAERAQRHVELAAERSHELAEKDAAERRITELYVAAVQQLGSDKAPVRLGGLYAMERIGNDYPKMRQTIMDVWCAYLRMPYAPPAEVLPDDGLSLPHPVAQNHVASDPEQASRRQELQVRLTAQRLIRTHLHAPSDMKTEPAAYWRGPDGERMNLDVSGATLVEFNLSACQLDTLIATNAQFHGHADMTRAQFHGAVTLSGAQFHGWAYLTHAHFYGDTSLDWAQFHTESYLTGAHFRRDTYLTGVQFMAFTTLAAAQFYGKVDLMDGQFHGQADLAATRFRGHVNLSDAQFREGLAMTTTQFDRMPVVHRMAVARPADLPVGWMADTDQGPEGRFEVLFATATTATATAAPATDSAAMAMGADVHQPTEDATEPITAPW